MPSSVTTATYYLTKKEEPRADVSKKFSVNVRMYLVRQRFYQVKVAMRNSLEKDAHTIENVKKFMDEFLFVYQKENEKKYSFGLPESISQNLDRRKH